jgi:dTDP-4-amino-4,6-dideoxygalactose transaminase
LLHDLGQAKKYEHVVKGDNCRLDSLQAAVLDVKLRHLDAWNQARREHAAAYDRLLPEIGIEPPVSLNDEGHVYHLYVIEVENRDRVQAALRERGVASGVHYPIPIHLQRAYADLALGRGSFPQTERSASRVLSLPMFAELTDDQIVSVVDALASCRPLHV